MSNYPDGVNFAIWDRMHAEPTDAESALDAQTANVMDACKRAWQKWSLSSQHADRWSLVASALLKASQALDKLVSLSTSDVEKLGREIDFARDANEDGQPEGFQQCIESYMAVYEHAVKREAA